MGGNRMPRPPREARRDPRVLVCARALVKAEGTPATEHMTHDLSVGGVRLCGLPRAQVGDRMSLLLHLPKTWVPAIGRLVRVACNETNPQFALQFEGMEPDSEDAIQDAVLDALDHANRRSLLLVRSRGEPQWRGWDWLSPLSPICVEATTPLEVMSRVEENDISVAIIGKAAPEFALSDWEDAVPELAWRTMDYAGRLRPTATGSDLRWLGSKAGVPGRRC